MKISQAVADLKLCMELKLPVHLWGAPGIGKSSIVRQLAQQMGRKCRDIRMTLLNPVDLRGIPVARDGITEWLAPAFLPHDPKSTDVVFLDELNAAPPAVQAAAYQLVLDRRVGEYQLPEGCVILAAGNRGTDRAVTYEMPSPLRNRFVHIEVEHNLEDWKDWALGTGINPMVVSFLNFKSELLFKFDPKVHTRAFPTPRSWEFASKLVDSLGVAAAAKKSELFAGLLHEGAAGEFCAFMKVCGEIPDADAIITGGKLDIKAPKDTDVLYAFCGALVNCCVKSEKKHEFDAARNLSKYVAKAMAPEFAVMALKDYARTPQFKGQYQKLLSTPEWRTFCEKYGNLIIG
jgi:hypothetical protein